MKRLRTLVCAVLPLALSLPAAAHHSGAMFDDTKSVTLSGTVKEFQWTNPHCWIQLLVPGESEATAEWSVEMGAPFELYRSGLRPSTVKTGDRLTIVVHPMRDGSHGGIFVSATGPDGKPFGKVAK